MSERLAMRSIRVSHKRTATSLPKRAASFRFRVVVMAKDPILGRVKTRLAREIGAAGAIRFYRATTSALADRLTRDPRFDTLLGVSPDTACASRASALRNLSRRLPQGYGDLGTRMLHLAATAPPGPVLIVGSDIPSITPNILAHALHLLGRNDIVVGPATDGGFWLIGFARRLPLPRNIFASVRWSQPDTLADVLSNAADHSVGRAKTLSDVDSAADLCAATPWVGRRAEPVGSDRKPI